MTEEEYLRKCSEVLDNASKDLQKIILKFEKDMGINKTNVNQSPGFGKLFSCFKYNTHLTVKEKWIFCFNDPFFVICFIITIITSIGLTYEIFIK